MLGAGELVCTTLHYCVHTKHDSDLIVHTMHRLAPVCTAFSAENTGDLRAVLRPSLAYT